MTAGNRRCSGKKIWGNKSRGPLELVPPCQLRTSEATERGSNYPRSQAQASRRRRRRRTNVPHVSVSGAPRPPLGVFISNHQQHTIHPFCIATVSTGSALPYDGHAAAVTVPFPSSSYSRHRPSPLHQPAPPLHRGISSLSSCRSARVRCHRILPTRHLECSQVANAYFPPWRTLHVVARRHSSAS